MSEVIFLTANSAFLEVPTNNLVGISDFLNGTYEATFPLFFFAIIGIFFSAFVVGLVIY